MTMKDMCETVERAGIIKELNGHCPPTAEQIFNYSPTGELSRVFEWYAMAQLVLGEDKLNAMSRKDKATERMVGDRYLKFTYLGEDISEFITYENGKSNPFGWSCYDIIHAFEKIGIIYCGFPKDLKEGYTIEGEEVVA